MHTRVEALLGVVKDQQTQYQQAAELLRARVSKYVDVQQAEPKTSSSASQFSRGLELQALQTELRELQGAVVDTFLQPRVETKVVEVVKELPMLLRPAEVTAVGRVAKGTGVVREEGDATGRCVDTREKREQKPTAVTTRKKDVNTSDECRRDQTTLTHEELTELFQSAQFGEELSTARSYHFNFNPGALLYRGDQQATEDSRKWNFNPLIPNFTPILHKEDCDFPYTIPVVRYKVNVCAENPILRSDLADSASFLSYKRFKKWSQPSKSLERAPIGLTDPSVTTQYVHLCHFKVVLVQFNLAKYNDGNSNVIFKMLVSSQSGTSKVQTDYDWMRRPRAHAPAIENDWRASRTRAPALRVLSLCNSPRLAHA
ncbi:unnamed protein product [Phytophthora fragariaefolia]|uniref:Unnamed protein product n=1 Tax=Phytophthora fragariaefolia TaxID=1490495 RepID=A0A9W7D3D7_9STRA|nr:unnamed protein product [Phytophthora fragariaefolia]